MVSHRRKSPQLNAVCEHCASRRHRSGGYIGLSDSHLKLTNWMQARQRQVCKGYCKHDVMCPSVEGSGFRLAGRGCARAVTVLPPTLTLRYRAKTTSLTYPDHQNSNRHDERQLAACSQRCADLRLSMAWHARGRGASQHFHDACCLGA